MPTRLLELLELLARGGAQLRVEVRERLVEQEDATARARSRARARRAGARRRTARAAFARGDGSIPSRPAAQSAFVCALRPAASPAPSAGNDDVARGPSGADRARSSGTPWRSARSRGVRSLTTPSADQDLARGRLLEPGDHPEQRRLARTRRARGGRGTRPPGSPDRRRRPRPTWPACEEPWSAPVSRRSAIARPARLLPLVEDPPDLLLRGARRRPRACISSCAALANIVGITNVLKTSSMAGGGVAGIADVGRPVERRCRGPCTCRGGTRLRVVGELRLEVRNRRREAGEVVELARLEGRRRSCRRSPTRNCLAPSLFSAKSQIT